MTDLAFLPKSNCSGVSQLLESGLLRAISLSTGSFIDRGGGATGSVQKDKVGLSQEASEICSNHTSRT